MEITAIVSGLIGSFAVLSAITFSIQYILRWNSRKVGDEVQSKEKELLNNIEASSVVRRDLALKWKTTAGQDKPQESELRTIVDELSGRLRILETVPEQITVRRQALLETYHNQGLSQSRISFIFSLLLGIAGFGIIAFAVFTSNAETATYLSGAITEAVAALFFTQSNQARKLMSQFFDKLRDDRKLEESLTLARGIEDDELRSRLQALLAMQLVGSSHSPGVLPGFSSEVPTDRTNLPAEPGNRSEDVATRS